jgi:hypothetical protein
MVADTPDPGNGAVDWLPVPDVIIGGAPRSGTTFLAEVLAKHPDVHIARPLRPEPKVCLAPHPEGRSGYLRLYAGYFAEVPVGRVRIEKTTNYFENEQARGRLHDLLPNTKFLFILREPVARAYSNWLWSRQNGLETVPFLQAVFLEGQRPSPLPPEKSAARPFDYIGRGLYGSLAERWIEAFGRERIRFFLLEDALAEPDGFVASVQRFIEVRALPWCVLQTGKVNAWETDQAGIDSGLAEELRKFFAPEVRQFASATGVDVARWGY